jgi:outer membrane protein TolC
MFRQLLEYVYPEYSMGFTLTIPIKNRAAQADDVRARIERHQAEVAFERTKSSVDVQVRTGISNLIQSQAQVEAAHRAFLASETAANAEQDKWEEGITILDNVLQTQLDLMNARFAEIQSRVNYAKAVIAEEVAVGNLLESQGIDFEQALRGRLWTDSTPDHKR